MFERLAGKILQRFLSKYFTAGPIGAEEEEQQDPATTNAASSSSSNATPSKNGSKNGSSSNSQQQGSTPSAAAAAAASASGSWTSMGVWSGYVSLQDLGLKTDIFNAKLRAMGQPFEIVHGSIARLELTVPWSKLSSTASSSACTELDPSAAVVVVLDGVHLLLRTRYEFDDEALKKQQIEKRQKALKEASVFKTADGSSSSSSSSWFKDVLQQRLQQGILPQIANNLQIHIRDLHIRLEDVESDPANPFSCGIVLESMHVQHADEQQQQFQRSPTQPLSPQLYTPLSPPSGNHRSPARNSNNNTNNSTIRKVSQLNHFAIYWNALDDEPGVATENSILQRCTSKEIKWALDRGIARRANSLARPRAAPKHSYLLVPIDATLQAHISTDPTQLRDQPAVSLVFSIPDLTFQVRDFQCVQVLLLTHMIQEHKYSKRYRRYRPTVSVHEDPRAWWLYAEQVVLYEIKENRVRWSWRRFRQRYELRKRYCDLYERKLRTPPPDAAAGPELAEVASGLSEAEVIELQEMEDGLRGDLSVDDLILYRVVVSKRIGLQARTGYATGGQRSSWFRRSVHSMVGDDEEAEEEYERLLAYWHQSSDQAANLDGNNDNTNSRSLIAVAMALEVKAGHITYFSPLSLTADQKQLRRLQEQFLDFTFTDFVVSSSLMGDFESLLIKLSVSDFIAEEMRSDRNKYTVITRADPSPPVDPFASNETAPLFALLLTKNPPSANDFQIGVQAQLFAIEVNLVPECEWVGRLQQLLQPIPQLRKAANFWGDMSMAYINSWASNSLDRIFAKAQTAMSEHKNMDIDVQVECPLIRIADGEGADLVIDLGQARLRTVKLAGVADAKLVHSLQKETSRESEVRKRSTSVKTPTFSGDDTSHGSHTWHTEKSTVVRMNLFADDASRNPELLTALPAANGKVPGRTVTWDRKSHRSLATGSVFGGSIGVDKSTRIEGEAFSIVTKGPRPGADDVESFFYDVYELQARTGQVAISPGTANAKILTDGIDFQVTLHKSIIPSDHTLCRLKVYCTVGEMMLSISESKVLHLAKFAQTWALVFAGVAPLPVHTPLQEFNATPRRLQVDRKVESWITGFSDSASVIDENEFFDAVDHESYGASDANSHLLDDSWVEDTESVIESETRSLSQSLSRNRRPRSISDISSISDGGSATRRRAKYQEKSYLSADNLARLEEAADESGGEDDDDSDDASFHSALTPSHLVDLESDLANNIEQAEAHVCAIEQSLRDLQMRNNSGVESKESMHRRKMLRLELRRSTAEVEAMKAMRFDLISQIDRTPEDFKDDESIQRALRAQSLSARNALLLLQSAKQRAANPITVEHSMTRFLKRDLLQFTFVFAEVALQLEDIEHPVGTGGSTGALRTIVLCITRSAGVFRKSIGDSKCHVSVDHVSLSLRRDSPLETHQHLLIVGGATDTLSGGLLPSRFPQYISSASMDDRFMRGAFEIRHGVNPGDGRAVPNITKLRLVLGDIEARPRIASVEIVRDVLDRVRRGLRSGDSRPSERSDDTTSLESLRSNEFFDLKIRIGSLRALLDGSGGIAAAVAVTDVGFRFTGIAKTPLYKDRSQFDARLGNVQVLCIDDFESGHGFEVFGKRDQYSPLSRVWIKSQLVLENETGGWVVGQSVSRNRDRTGDHAASMNSCVLNVNAGIKLDSIGVLVSPESIMRLHESVTILRDAARGSSESLKIDEAAVTHERVSYVDEEPKARLAGYPVRWRIDISLKKSSVSLRKLGLEDGATAKRQTLLISSSMLASLQQVQHDHEGAIIQATFRGLEVSRVSDEWPLLESTVVVVRMITPLRNRPCTVLKHPHLILPDPTWNEAETAEFDWSLREESAPGSNVALSLLVSVSPVKLNVSDSVAALLAEVVPPLLSTLKHNAPKRAEKESPPSRFEPPVGQHLSLEISFQILAEKIQTVVFREGINAISIATAEALASLLIEDLTGSFRKKTDSIIVSASVARVALVDYTCRQGIQAFGSSDREGRPESGDGTAKNGPSLPKFVVFTCDVTRLSDRILGHLDMQLGQIQCLLLPSLARSLLTFQKNISERLPRLPKASHSEEVPTSADFQATVRHIQRIDLSIGMQSLECILPSRDLPKYVRESSKDSVGVVTFRLRLNALGTIEVMLLDTEPIDSMNALTLPGEDRHLVKGALADFLKRRIGTSEGSATALLSSLELSVTDFQVLRTTVNQSETTPHLFHVAAPSAGEQRITNSFSFGVTHDISGAWFPAVNTSRPDDDSCFSLSQGIHLKAEFVDVLLYIAQSPGGMSDAMRVTVKPILDMLKRGDNTVTIDERPSKAINVKTLLARASTVCSLKAKGMKLTCVPGGATRLTESPIIKFALLHLSCGGAAVPAPGDTKLLSEANVDAMTKTSGGRVQHLLAGGWLSCEASASYHNRRLVAWEPFIEPWTLEIRLGVDLVRALNMQPLFDESTVQWNSPEQPIQSSLAASLGSGGARLRGIGRLLRSPFRSGKTSFKENGNLELSQMLVKDLDFCYLTLASSANEMIADALFQPSSATGRAPISVLPRANPAQWLSRFGYPFAKSSNLKDLANPAVICWVADAAPLNINLTGALIENLAQYRDKDEGDRSGKIAPHWIRNDTGLTLRFQEVLDHDRLEKGEKARKVTLANGTEVPLSLKRSLSQSCDPHNAYITVELGSFEDTVGRVDHQRLDVPKGFRSSTFYYRTAAKILVDTVGVHSYPLDLSLDKRSDPSSGFGSASPSHGWVIVRVALRGGVKMVSFESPVVVKNVSDCDIVCEVRDHDGLSSLWRCLIPRGDIGEEFVPVPADLAPFIHKKNYIVSAIALPKESSFQHESELEVTDKGFATALSPPPPYSRASFIRGFLGEISTRVPVLKTGRDGEASLFLNICSLRVGTFSLEPSTRVKSGSKTEPEIPEQRMLLFRSPLVVRNHLALPIRVQARLKGATGSTTTAASMLGRAEIHLAPSSPEEQDQCARADKNWVDLGILECGRDLSWTGAVPSEKVELRVRITDDDGGTSRQFPNWSTPVTIEPDPSSLRERSRTSTTSAFIKLPKLRLEDSSKSPLLVSLAMSRGNQPTNSDTSFDNVGDLSRHMPPGSRVISLYTPFWVVDGTGLDLQYNSGSFVAGQVDAGLPSNGDDEPHRNTTGSTLGLGELLDDSDLIYLPSRLSFQVLMIGEETSSKLQVRRRLTRMDLSRDSLSAWSDPIPLAMRASSYHDTAVMPPSRLLSATGEDKLGASDVVEPFALRSRVVRAADTMGGAFGTKLVHIVCRYSVVNEMGREIEVVGVKGQHSPLIIQADGRPRPFHFDDSGAVRFRPKEFGWQWSGLFRVKSNRREITMRLRHKLKGHSILATVELHAKEVAGTCIIVFRPAAHAPYRIENHSMYPIQYSQKLSAFRRNRLSRDGFQDTVILPYHHADFAWDEPDFGRRSLLIEVADFGNLPNQMNRKILGSFRLDQIAPGTELRLGSPLLLGYIIADGPTRVLRITETSSPRTTGRIGDYQEHFRTQTRSPSGVTTMISVKFSHGLGISVVDWKPQELVYIRMDNILLEQVSDGERESGSASIGSIVVDNQLWVTPYPVMLRMGSRSTRRRNKRSGAISLLWSRSLNSRSGFGDLTLLEKVELSTEPSIISIDGNIGKLAIEMTRHVKELGTSGENGSHIAKPPSRNEVLRKVLGIVENVIGTENAEPTEATRNASLVNDLYSAVDYMATAAIAAKLRSRYRAPSLGGNSGGQGDYVPSQELSRGLPKSKRKYYIEKLRISTTAAQVSWSGFLPIASTLPRLMRPALTFEGLPLFLRSFTSSHTYGTADEHLRSLKSHYISIWRIIDLLVGVLTKPTFLIRACIFTSRESFASTLSSMSGGFHASERSLRSLIPRQDAERDRSISSVLFRVIIQPVLKFNASVLHTLSCFTAFGSAILSYDPAMHRASGGLVRSRNPRLFANVDGKDLLVEYVEGENAGKALLSRVRMGAHLGEGYIYHIEGTHLRKESRRKPMPDESDSTVLIFMMTFERILLLNGQLNAKFCEVVWEASFENLIHVETSDETKDESYGLVLLWFLAYTGIPIRNRDERHANAILGDASGLNTLDCKYIYVPKAIIKVLLFKIASVNPSLVEQIVPQ